MLCVACTTTRQVVIIDPFNPHDNRCTKDSVQKAVLKGLKVVSPRYDTKYGIDSAWPLIPRNDFTHDLNLPV